MFLKTILILSFTLSLFAQNAADYFPASTGHIWWYNSVPLDSVNNPIDSLEFVRIDSFASVGNYEGRTTNFVLTKSGPANTILNQSFNDTLFYNFTGSDANEYLAIGRFDSIIVALDSLLGDSTSSFRDLFIRLEDWYLSYRFSANVNQSYSILQYDTTLTIQSNDYAIRIQLEGERLNDEFINTAIGGFNCKKFIYKRQLFYLLLGFIPIEIISVEETIWIAENEWILKTYTPSTVLDLTPVGGGVFVIPGLSSEISSPITYVNNGIVEEIGFLLYQNYPNPFNPTTKIKFTIPRSTDYQSGQFAELKIFDVLGNAVATLVNEYKPAGTYEIEFDGDFLSTGMYFYTLKTGNKQQTRKMLLIK